MNGLTKLNCEALLLTFGFERYVRSPPDRFRRNQFLIGWENAVVRFKTYTDETLKRLTWHNLGYRLGKQFGEKSRREIDEIYELFSQHYQNPIHYVNEKPKSVAGEVEQSSMGRSLRIGAGFGDSETNRKVERAATSFVTQWYESRGWKVESVEAEKRGYDLLCVKGSAEEHVEVKGVQGDLPAFIITAGEVRQAQNNSNFVICVVTSALKENPKLFRYVGKEFVDKFDLAPLAYRAILRE